MNVDTLALILVGIICVGIGGAIGNVIATKTKLVQRLSGNKKEKILRDPELLKKKIEDTVRMVNPDATGTPKIIDEGKEIRLDIVEKDGKKILQFNRVDYIPEEREKSPMVLGQEREEKKEEIKKVVPTTDKPTDKPTDKTPTETKNQRKNRIRKEKIKAAKEAAK